MFYNASPDLLDLVHTSFKGLPLLLSVFPPVITFDYTQMYHISETVFLCSHGEQVFIFLPPNSLLLCAPTQTPPLLQPSSVSICTSNLHTPLERVILPVGGQS